VHEGLRRFGGTASEVSVETRLKREAVFRAAFQEILGGFAHSSESGRNLAGERIRIQVKRRERRKRERKRRRK
jgi:hypothetical protein